MHTTFGCACLLTDEFVVVADVFFRKDDGKGCGAPFSLFASEPPYLNKRQRHTFNNQRLPVFISNEHHLSHNGPEMNGDRFIVLGREPRKIRVTGLDQAHFEQIQGHYARTREPCQMFGKRCLTGMRGALKEKDHRERRKERLKVVIESALSAFHSTFVRLAVPFRPS